MAHTKPKPHARVPATVPSRAPSGDSLPGYDTATGRNPNRRRANLVEKALKKYSYDPLPDGHVRVLLLHPKDKDDERVDVTLSQVSFDELGSSTEYEALSYHWDWGFDEFHPDYRPISVSNDINRILAKRGNASNTQATTGRTTAHVSDLVSSMATKTMYVKPNLYHALRHLRLEHKHVALWVDALCIDQDNQKEKQKQVARMDRIYSKASSVLVWLGEGDDQTHRAMGFVKNVINFQGLNDLVTDASRISDWSALIHLMRRSWFSRRWVIQELALASTATVHCGADIVHWNDFRDAVSLFAHDFDRIRPLFKRSPEYDHDFYAIGHVDPLGAKVLVDTINSIFRRNKRGTAFEPIQGLEYLVSTLSSFNSSDPRDTLHALNNIAKETCPRRRASDPSMPARPPKPDYTKTLLQVYCEYVRWVADTSASIDVICRQWALPERRYTDDNYPQLSALPSWIQVISDSPRHKSDNARQSPSKDRTDGDSFVGLPGERNYNACHGLPANVQFVFDSSGSSASSSPVSERSKNAFVDQSASRRALMGTAKDYINSNQMTQSGTELQARLEAFSIRERSREQSQDSAKAGLKRQRQDKNAITGLDSTTGIASDDDAQIGAEQEVEPAEEDDDTRSVSSHSSSNSFASSSSSEASDEFERAEKLVIDQLLNQKRDASMYVNGIQVGTVGYCTEPIPDGVIPEKAVRKLRRASKKDDPDKIWRTLVAERGDSTRNPPPWYERACQHCIAYHTANGHINTKELLAKTTQPDHVRKFLQRVQSVIWNRCFMEVETKGVEEKLHGFGPSRAQKGDLLCILFGCSVPCLLRPRRHPIIGEYYLFVGEAYVYGIMDGEAVSDLSKDQIEKSQKTFRLL